MRWSIDPLTPDPSLVVFHAKLKLVKNMYRARLLHQDIVRETNIFYILILVEMPLQPLMNVFIFLDGNHIEMASITEVYMQSVGMENLLPRIARSLAHA